ncbi:unnamed protein product [Cuscuta epithymum]|uniref:Cystatin domain-containing protein n=1 Tax=Cuscuta epithymum TaxID=186058 RepID=A0AAV0GGM2_9ASTE|nr:unnamed protein product [Cuscuta epithymum]
MAAISETKPEKKPELDHDVTQKIENLDSIGQDTNTGLEYESLSDSDGEFGGFLDLSPRDLESEETVELCKLALSHYLEKHVGEAYEFVRVESGRMWFSVVTFYELRFYAKNLRANGNLHTFEASAHTYYWDKPEEKSVQNCVLLKWAWQGIAARHIPGMPESSIDILNNKEAAKLVELSKFALSDYQNNHPEESYEFEKVLKAKYRIYCGVEYNILFQAKCVWTEDRATFQAFVINYVQASQVEDCELVLKKGVSTTQNKAVDVRTTQIKAVDVHMCTYFLLSLLLIIYFVLSTW